MRCRRFSRIVSSNSRGLGWHLLKTRTELTAEVATAVGELVEQIREIVRR
jgi:hypothetical protein